MTTGCEWQTVRMLDFAKQDLPTLLLVDDDMVSREVMATVLTMSGYAVHTADGGAAALTLLNGGGCVPGVILMDAQMPGLSGVELIGKLRTCCGARLYVISGSDAEDEVIAAADGFLLKPFSPEAFARLLEDQIAQSQPALPAGLDPTEVVVNHETVARLREMMSDAQIRQIFEAILADLGRRTDALESAIAQADWPETRCIGHAIKGGAAMAGAEQLSRLGQLIEAGALEPRASSLGVNQVDNSNRIIGDLRSAALNLQRILDAEFKP
ncbi:MAG: response regulator [Terracidiphilus sp.]